MVTNDAKVSISDVLDIYFEARKSGRRSAGRAMPLLDIRPDWLCEEAIQIFGTASLARDDSSEGSA
jgi:hypothetical protein